MKVTISVYDVYPPDVDTTEKLYSECSIEYRVTTAEQFTDVYDIVVARSRWRVVAVVKALLAFRRKYRAQVAKPGEREAKGWN